MRSFIRKIARTDLGILLRNSLNLKPVDINIDNVKHSSVSDAFAWRTDNNFITKFKYSDILNIFFKIKNSWVEFNFFSKDNELIKQIKIDDLDLSNELIINSELLDGLKDYGTFYVYHFTDEIIDNENIISNKCYLGYSQNNQLYSFVHGNILVKYKKIHKDKKEFTNMVKTSFFKNHYYKIQKYFDNFDKSELFFANPTSKTIIFTIDDITYKLNGGCSLIIDITRKKIPNIKSNCLFL